MSAGYYDKILGTNPGFVEAFDVFSWSCGMRHFPWKTNSGPVMAKNGLKKILRETVNQIAFRKKHSNP